MFISLALLAARIGRVAWDSHALWGLGTAALTGYLAADFISGFVHWAGDTIGDAQTPIFGPNFVTPFSIGPPAQENGKHPVRSNSGDCTAAAYNMSEPSYMFVAVPNSQNGTGVVDVIVLDGAFSRVDTDKFHAGIQSIQAPSVQAVVDFLRQ